MPLSKIDEAGLASSAQFTGFKNRIINGAMVIAQRGTAAVTTNGAFPVDRWVQFMSGGGVITGIQDSDVPSSAFQYSTKLTATTADASIAAADFYALNHNIEGFNAADLGFGTATASTVTLSFWVKSSVTGTYAVALYNSAGTRGYPATYTISVANTWTFISLTIPGDTGGTWLKDNGTGITIRYDLGTGSNGNGTANTWNTSGTFAASRTSSTVNWISTLNATFFITGVQLEKGSTATSFDYRPYSTELQLCQRYYQFLNRGLCGGAESATQIAVAGVCTIPMRASPTIALAQTTPQFISAGTIFNGSGSAITDSNINFDSYHLRISGFSGLTAGRACVARFGSGGGFLTLSSEL
jgi:hypothetical protein